MYSSQIKEVSVYRRGCVITRLAVLDLKKGSQTVRIGGFGSTLDQSSMRLHVSDGLTGSNVQGEEQDSKEQEEAVREGKKRLERIAARIASLRKQAALWETNADFSEKESVSISEMMSYLDELPGRLSAFEDDIAALEEEKEELEKQIEEAAEKAAAPYVCAELTAEEDGTYPVQLVYQDYCADWQPCYEIHAEDGSDTLLLRLRARIHQSAAEDWSGVQLKLYSGNPSVSGTIPRLYPAHVSFYVPRPAAGAVSAPRMLMKSAARATDDMEETMLMEDAAAPVMGMAAMNFTAVNESVGSASQGETMMEYSLSGSWDIRKGQEIVCDLTERNVPCVYQVISVPKSSPNAYLAAEVATAELEEMQDSPAAVYLNGTYAGDVYLQVDFSEEKYNLSLGVDETVKVKRTQKKKFTSQILLKGQKKTEYEYELSVSSRKNKACRVLVKDQIPVSDEKTISIEAGDLGGGELEEKTGLVSWSFTLDAGETRVLPLAYTIAWPKDKTLSGAY